MVGLLAFKQGRSITFDAFVIEAKDSGQDRAMAVRSIEEGSTEEGGTGNEQDQLITAPHLANGAQWNLTHAKAHAARLDDPDVLADPQSVLFNLHHMRKHLAEGADHVNRLVEHLSEHDSDAKTFAEAIAKLPQLPADTDTGTES